MINIGPQVAFVDDVQAQITPLYNVMTQDIHTGAVFFDASPYKSKFPDKPLESVKLLFLDLYFNDARFDPDLCAQWVISIIAPNTKYSLIIWSRDTEKAKEVLNLLKENDHLPSHTESWQKTDYNLPSFDFTSKIQNLIKNISGTNETNEVILGEIVSAP